MIRRGVGKKFNEADPVDCNKRLAVWTLSDEQALGQAEGFDKRGDKPGRFRIDILAHRAIVGLMEQPHDHIESVCGAIEQHLLRLAEARGCQRISEDEFITAVLKIEEAEVAPAGLNLSVSNTRDDWTVFKIRHNGTSEICAAFEFLPLTGEFRRVGSCRLK